MTTTEAFIVGMFCGELFILIALTLLDGVVRWIQSRRR